MADYQRLDPAQHSELRIDEEQRAALFAERHMVNIELKEVVQAAADFPLFISKISDSSQWAVSALCGLTPAENVFLDNNQWLAQYTPLSLQTLPFILQSQGPQSEADLLIDCHSSVLSKTQGEALYLSTGRATVYLNNKKKLLTERVTAMTQTTDLLHEMANLGLFRPINLVLLFADGSRQKIGGLYGVDEQALHALSAEDLKRLNTNNTLAALFNILGSVFQVNRLIRLHNQKFPNRAVSNIKIETNKP